MSIKHTEKGRALEQAVKFIQEVILESSPEMVGKNFTIETNVRQNFSGVTHEIDVLVRTNRKSDYEAIWIFECKNWTDPVDKDVVTVLADKVDAWNANKGFLVAKRITSGAEAQLKKYPRLGFIRCSESFSGPLTDVQLTHIFTDSLPTTIKIHFRDRLSNSELPPLDYSKTPCRRFGQPADFLQFIQSEVEKVTRKDLAERNNQYKHIGTHWGHPHVLLDFQYGELELNGFAVDSIELPLFYFVINARAIISSKFELEGKGRFISFESSESDLDGKKIEFQFIQKL